MPLYGYLASDEAWSCGHCRSGFECRQSMADEPLKACPKCGAPVWRVITAPAIAANTSPKNVLSDKNIKKHGFTKLVNEGGGKFRKI